MGWGKIKDKFKEKTNLKTVASNVLGDKAGGALSKVFSSSNIAKFIPVAAVGFESGRRELLKTPYASYFQGQVNGMTGGIGGDLLAGIADRVTNGSPEDMSAAVSEGSGGGGYWGAPAVGISEPSSIPGWVYAVGAAVVALLAFLVIRKK